MGDVELAIRDLDFEAVWTGAILRLSGNGDGAIVSQLTQLIAELHGQLAAARSSQVTVDIRALEFMSASCFNVLVSWLGLIHDLPATERYRLRFSTNAAIPWQRRSLHTLSCFATDLVEVEG